MKRRPSRPVFSLLTLLMANFLTQEQKNELLRELRSEGRARFSDRIKVILLLDKGWTYQKISEILNSEGILTIDGKHWSLFRVQQTAKPYNGKS